jgi:hypothetical protein
MNGVLPWRSLLLVSVVLLCSCDSNEVEGPLTVELNISGTITAEADGSPIQGARVFLRRMIVPGSAETTSDGEGRYAIRLSLEKPGAYEWADPCGTFKLEVRANGYVGQETWERTDHFPNLKGLRCTSEPQTIDFSLERCTHSQEYCDGVPLPSS